MPLYEVSFRQAHDATFATRRKWSNVLHVTAATSVAAAAAGVVAWEAYLRNMQNTTIFCYEVYATDKTVGTDDYAIQPVPQSVQRGTIVPAGGEHYLPKVCNAVTLTVPGSRPSRKFWRMDLREGDISEGTGFNPNYVAGINAAIAAMIAADPGLWQDPDGQAVTAVQKVTLTTREFGRESTVDVPLPPPVG